ncbi:hypothetical protein D0Y65_050626, partial [Glycine soja]
YYYIIVKVFHYGFFQNLRGKFEPTLEKGKDVSLFVDEFRRKLNSRLNSAGHLLDICLPRIGLGNLEPGTISQNEMQSKKKDLELEANALIFVGGKVSVDILLYDEATKLCGGSEDSIARIWKIVDGVCDSNVQNELVNVVVRQHFKESTNEKSKEPTY